MYEYMSACSQDVNLLSYKKLFNHLNTQNEAHTSHLTQTASST